MTFAHGAGLLLGALMVLYLIRAVWLPPIGRYLVVSDPLSPADAIVSLAGDPQRPLDAARIHRRGYARGFLITNLPLDSEGARTRYVGQVREIATNEGVPDASIHIVPGVARTTYEEALDLRRYVEARGLGSLIVVTSPWHTRRAKMIFDDVFRDTDVTVRIRPVSDEAYGHAGHVYRPDEWWTYRLGRRPTASEYLKIVAYYLRIR